MSLVFGQLQVSLPLDPIAFSVPLLNPCAFAPFEQIPDTPRTSMLDAFTIIVYIIALGMNTAFHLGTTNLIFTLTYKVEGQVNFLPLEFVYLQISLWLFFFYINSIYWSFFNVINVWVTTALWAGEFLRWANLWAKKPFSLKWQMTIWRNKLKPSPLLQEPAASCWVLDFIFQPCSPPNREWESERYPLGSFLTHWRWVAILPHLKGLSDPQAIT